MKPMIHDIIDFAKLLFPVVSEYDTEKLKGLVAEQFDGQNCVFLQNPPVDYQSDNPLENDVKIVQGDIFQGVPFLNINSSGSVVSYKAYGVVIANTCDAQRNEHILIAPFRPLSDFENEQQRITITKNRLFSYMYLNSTDTNINVSFIDFNRTNAINLEFFKERVKKQLTQRKYSLTLYGYYMLLIKLSIYLHRPEDDIVQSARKYYTRM